MPHPDEVVVSRSNARLKQLRAAVGGNTRLSGGLVAIEGEHLVAEAVRSDLPLRTIFLAGQREVPDGLDPKTEIVRVAESAFRSAVETRAPQGIAALIEPPVWAPEAVLGGAGRAPLVVVLAELQDPGNVGTLLRSAEAFGATGVVLSAASANVWSGKTMRASAGAVFRLPTVRVDGAAEVQLLLRRVRLLAAVGSPGNASDLRPASSFALREAAEEDLTGPIGLVLGNEGAGLGPEWLGIADARVTIPCTGPVESLNAAIAGAILLYEAQQQRRLLTRTREARAAGRGPELVRRGAEREGRRTP